MVDLSPERCNPQERLLPSSPWPSPSGRSIGRKMASDDGAHSVLPFGKKALLPALMPLVLAMISLNLVGDVSAFSMTQPRSQMPSAQVDGMCKVTQIVSVGHATAHQCADVHHQRTSGNQQSSTRLHLSSSNRPSSSTTTESAKTGAASANGAKRTSSSSATNNNDSGKDSDEAVLSDVDARVLQAMLADDKLNVKEETNLRGLLDRGIRSKESASRNETSASAFQDDNNNNSDSKFSSKLLQKLSDTKLWNVVKRNAKDIVESAKIFVSNRVERDSQLLGALGLFAFERAARDVKRALPAAAKATKKMVQLQLGNSSSFSKMANTTGSVVFLGGLLKDDAASSTTMPGTRQDIVDDMTTAGDEIRAVSESIREIFRSGGGGVSTIGRNAGPSSTGMNFNLNVNLDANHNSNPNFNVHSQDGPALGPTFADRRGLRSTVDKSKSSSTERFARAYERTKATKLKQERENVAQKATRATGSLVDSAYELRRELQSEVNEPGFRSKQLRESAAATSRQLQAGAQRLIEGVRKDGLPALGSKSSSNASNASPSTPGEAAAASSKVEVEHGFTPLSWLTGKKSAEASAPTVADAVVDAATAAASAPAAAAGIPASDTASPAAAVAMAAAESSETTVSMEFATDPDVDVKLGDIQRRSQVAIDRVLERLKMCIESSDTTWLDPRLLSNDTALKTMNIASVECIMDSLISAQTTIKLDKQIVIDSGNSPGIGGGGNSVETIERWLDTTIEAREMIDEVVATAKANSTHDIVEYLRDYLIASINVDEDTKAQAGDVSTPFLLQLDDVQSQFETLAKIKARRVSQTPAEPTGQAAQPFGTTQNESMQGKPREPEEGTPVRKVIADVVDAIPDGLQSVMETTSATGIAAETETGTAANMEQPTNVPAEPVQAKVASVVNAVAATRTPIVDATMTAMTVTSGVETVAASSTGSGVVAEVVSDDDFDKAMGGGSTAPGNEYKNAANAAPSGADAVEEEQKEPSFFVRISLRTLDVVFFMLEKTITEVLPAALTVGQRATKRIELAQRDGMGTQGWTQIKSVQRGSKRY